MMKTSRTYVILPVLSLLAASIEANAGPSGEDQVLLSLEQSRQMAMEHNPYILNSRLDIDAAVAQKREAVSEYFPKVSANAFSFYAFDPLLEIGVKDVLGNNDFSNNLQNLIDAMAGQLGFDPVYSTLKYGVTATVSVTQPLFAGGRIVNGNRLASLGIEAAELQNRIQTRASSEEVEESYWQVVSLEEKSRTLDQLQTLVDTLYKDVSSAVAAGLATENDLLQVKLKRNELRSGKIQVKNGIRLAKMNLFNMIGLGYNPYRTIPKEGVPDIDDIILTDRIDNLLPPEEYYVPEEEIAAGLEESRLLGLSVESRKLEKKMAAGEAMPQIGIGASYGYSNLINKGQMNGAVYAIVQIPISDWGKTARKMQRLDTQIQKAENEREYLGMQLMLQIRQMWMDLTASWEQLAVAKESVETAEASVRQLEDHYNAGLSPLSELLQAQSQLRQVSEEYIDQCIKYRTALQSYLNRCGEKYNN